MGLSARHLEGNGVGYAQEAQRHNSDYDSFDSPFDLHTPQHRKSEDGVYDVCGDADACGVLAL